VDGKKRSYRKDDKGWGINRAWTHSVNLGVGMGGRGGEKVRGGDGKVSPKRLSWTEG